MVGEQLRCVAASMVWLGLMWSSARCSAAACLGQERRRGAGSVYKARAALLEWFSHLYRSVGLYLMAASEVGMMGQGQQGVAFEVPDRGRDRRGVA
jgi:hypothetical protein